MKKNLTKLVQQTEDLDDLEDALDEEPECQSTRTIAKSDTNSMDIRLRLKKRQKVQRVPKRVVDDRPEKSPR